MMLNWKSNIMINSTLINRTFEPGQQNASDTLTLPFAAAIASVIYISVDLLIGLCSNILLMLIIFHSPSLRTPPNSHLVNICITNLVLCFCMILSIVTTFMPPEYRDQFAPLLQIQMFCVTTCSLQYLLTFAAIGFYRNKTMQRPHLSLKVRKSIVSRSIVLNWLITQLLSLILTMSFSANDHTISGTLNPLQISFVDNKAFSVTLEQLISLGLFMATNVIAGFVIFRSYYNICRTLNIIGSNRVTPTDRHVSLTSETMDDQTNKGQGYKSGSNVIRDSPYCIREDESDISIIVHYRRDEHELAFEDILALENPILANSIRDQRRKRALQPTLSNSSATSTKSKCPDFSDISPNGDLRRFQLIKNNNALCKQSLRRDRVNLSSATKNSMVMLSAFAACSFPLFIASIPGCLGDLKMGRIYILLFFRLLFYLNVCIYPVWYLFFSKRVKKCMSRLYESVLVKLNLRQ